MNKQERAQAASHTHAPAMYVRVEPTSLISSSQRSTTCLNSCRAAQHDIIAHRACDRISSSPRPDSSSSGETSKPRDASYTVE